MKVRSIVMVALSSGLVLACGGSQYTSGGPQAGAPSGGIGAPGVPWKDKSREQRTDWMGLEVLPQMKATFTARDPEGFADFRCQTCHGGNMEAVDFKMPNALLSLPREGTIESARDYDAGMTDFMLTVVVPKMAELLDQEPYDAATGQGFGCFGCHSAE